MYKGAFIEKSESTSYCTCMLIKCRQDGKLLSKSDGQFTAGISHEEYLLEKKVYTFYIEKGKPFEMEAHVFIVLP